MKGLVDEIEQGREKHALREKKIPSTKPALDCQQRGLYRLSQSALRH